MMFQVSNSKLAMDGELRKLFLDKYKEVEYTENPGWSLLNNIAPSLKLECSTNSNHKLFENIKILSMIPDEDCNGRDKNN